MINWTIKIARPILTEGMFFQVRYRKVDSQDWIPFSPNPTTNEFTITALEDDTNYEAEIRTICPNGELSRPVYHQLKEGKKDDEPTQPQPPTTPDIKISWYDEERDYLTGDTTDMEGTDTEVSVGASENVIFEYKNPNRDWVVKSNRPHYLDSIPLEVGLNEIRAYKFINNSTKIYSNVLKYNKTQPVENTYKKYEIVGVGTYGFHYTDKNGVRQEVSYTDELMTTDIICALKGSVVAYGNYTSLTEKGNCDETRRYNVFATTDNFYFRYKDRFGVTQEVSEYSHHIEQHRATVCAIVGSIEGDRIEVQDLGECGIECQEYTIYSGLGRGLNISYVDCSGQTQYIDIPPDSDDRVEQIVRIQAIPGTINGNYSNIVEG